MAAFRAFEQALPLILMAVLLLTAPLVAAAAESNTSTPLTCQSPLWSSLPLAKQQTPVDDYSPSSADYYHDWALKHVLPPFIFCCISAAFLLAFLLWRLARLATCLPCIRGPRLRGEPALQLLSARSMHWLRALVPLLALGMIGGAGYGYSTIQPSIEPAGLSVYNQSKAYVAAGLSTANRTLEAADNVASQLATIRQRAVDLDLEKLQPGVMEAIDDFHASMADVTSGLYTATSDIQTSVLDRMERWQQDWQPLADRLDVVKNAALYACYTLVIAFALALALGVLLSCPGMVKTCTVALLLLILLTWAAVAASTTGLKVGSDGCAVVETKIIDALVKAAARQVAAGHGVLSSLGPNDTLALGRYYFYGVGKDPEAVLRDLTGIDVPQLLNRANRTVADLQQAAVLLKGVASSVRTLPDNLDVLAACIAILASNVSELEAALSYQRFHTTWMAAKSYACCDVLNFVAGLWLGLLVIGCCGLPMSLAVFIWIGRMDKLEPRGCCSVYRKRQYRQYRGQEGGGGSSADAAAAVPELGGSSKKPGDGETPLGLPPGTSAATSFSLNLHHKLAAAAAGNTAWTAGNSGGADTFRIPAAASCYAGYGSGAVGSGTPRSTTGALESCELLPDGTPSAPAMPLSARSMPSARGMGLASSSGFAARQPGSWAATLPTAGSAPLLPAAGFPSSSSAPGSARRRSATFSTAPSGLTPAAAALLPAEHEDVRGSELEAGEAAGGDTEQQQVTEAGEGGSSALKRASSALAKLKFTRRNGKQ